MNLDLSKNTNHPGRRRGTPIPVAPPRIPTPMPSNNNNVPRSTSKDSEPTKNHPSSVGSDIPKLITKASYKVLDNDVKTAWINPRLLSKIDMEIIKKTDYVPPSERNMNGHYHPQHSYQKQQSCGRVHDREWEAPVNGRAKPRSAVAVPAPISAAADARRRPKPTAAKPKAPMEAHAHPSNRNAKTKIKTPSHHQRVVPQRSGPSSASQSLERVKGVVGYHQSATACYVGGLPGPVHDSGGVYGVYAETKYIYAVNGLPGNPAQTSAAAAFFASVAHSAIFDTVLGTIKEVASGAQRLGDDVLGAFLLPTAKCKHGACSGSDKMKILEEHNISPQQMQPSFVVHGGAAYPAPYMP